MKVIEPTVAASAERAEFSERLRKALSNVDLNPGSPTELARQFNAYYGGKPITVHAARKWIVGEAIPTQEKLKVLAGLTRVKTEWLRFGVGLVTVRQHTAEGKPISTQDALLLERIHQMRPQNQKIARNFIKMLSLQDKQN